MKKCYPESLACWQLQKRRRSRRGRTFTQTDDANAPRVLLVNEEFVRRYSQDRNPLGRRIQLDSKDSKPAWGEIVGVVGNVKSCCDALSGGWTPLPLTNVMSMDAVIQRQRNGDPLFLRLLGTFALLALILAAIGIYGLIAYAVSQRTHEIGIRMALGAERLDISWMILKQGLKMALIGSALGLAIALPLPRPFDSLFEGMHFGAPGIYLAVLAAILMVTIVATYLPARRASDVHPNAALRHQ